MFTSTPSPLFHQLDLSSLHFSGRLLLHNPLQQTPPASASPTPATNPVDPTAPYNGTNGFDANVVMILSVLLCALICSLGLNSIIKCALRFASTPTRTDSNPTGIKRKALKTFAVVNYSPDLKLPGIGTECVICLSEFTLGERVRILPKCNHGFHVRCIDKWLKSHSSCPTCRHCLIAACQKIVGGCEQASSSQPTSEPQLTQETVINIVPLEREDLTRSYRCDS